jgi:hypothetical protein
MRRTLMTDLPERIWFNGAKVHAHMVTSSSRFAGGFEYLRADHVATLLAEERRKALEEALKAVQSTWEIDEAEEAIRALFDAPAREVTVREASPCGGCGESDPRKRCIGCLHDFGALSQGGED